MRRLHGLLAAVLTLVSAGSSAAQEYEVARRSFLFFGRHLEIDVTADGPGALQILRGEPGQIEVAGRADDGLAAFGLGGASGDRLQLSALGAFNASYIVVVPERVSVSVALPGQRYRTRLPDPTPVLRWDGTRQPVPAPVSIVEPDTNGLFLVHHDQVAPPQLILQQAAVRHVEVRVEGELFRVESSEPLHFRPAAGRTLTLNTGDRPIDLLVTLPVGTRFFQLQADQQVLLAVHEQRATTRCARGPGGHPRRQPPLRVLPRGRPAPLRLTGPMARELRPRDEGFRCGAEGHGPSGRKEPVRDERHAWRGELTHVSNYQTIKALARVVGRVSRVELNGR